MKVLFITRRRLPWGGERTQIEATAHALRQRGLKVTVLPDLPGGCREYDLVHFFGLDQDHADKIARVHGAVKALSPVFWDKYQRFGSEWERPQGSRIARRIARWRRKAVRRRLEQASPPAAMEGYLAAHRPVPLDGRDWNWAAFQDVIGLMDHFLPNSRMEMESVLRDFVFAAEPRWSVVHNAIDVDAIDEQSDLADRLGLGRFVLCSAGVDPRKNQYNLVRALVGTKVAVVAAGPVRDEAYAQATAALARSVNVDLRLVGLLARPDLNALYARATAHVLPSYHETPGISNLEAIAHGCPNVSTKLGGLEEYVGHHSLYCNPYSVPHIRQQALRALEMPRNAEGAAYVRERYTWANAARETLAGYEQALASAGG